MTTPDERRPSAADAMRARFAGEDEVMCGAYLHGDTSIYCHAREHEGDQVHVTEITSLNGEPQLIQWMDTPSESQPKETDYGAA